MSDDLEREQIQKVHTLIGLCTDISALEGVFVTWEERMKELAAEILKPGSDEVIKGFGLWALDYIWHLSGDRVSGPGMKFHAKALDYYWGRKVEHVWGTGIIGKMPDLRYGIKVRMRCQVKGCKSWHPVWFTPGVHTGGFCYGHIFENGFFKFRIDVREQWYHCGEH